MLSSASDGMGIQPQKFGKHRIAAMAQTNRLQAGEQTALLLIEQAIKQNDRGFELVWRNLKRPGLNCQRNGLGSAARQSLVAANVRFDGSVKKLPIHFGPTQAPEPNQVMQRFLYLGVHGIGKLMCVEATGGGEDKSFSRGEKSAIPGKPNRVVRPEPAVIEANAFGESIKATAMRVTGEVAELPQFAKHGEIGLGAEQAFEFRQFGDLMAAEMTAKD